MAEATEHTKTREIERRTYDRIRIAVELAIFVAGGVGIYLALDRRVGATESEQAHQRLAIQRLATVPESLAEIRTEQRAQAASVARIERAVEALARPR